MREVSYGSGVDHVVPSSENCILVVAVAPVALSTSVTWVCVV